MLFYCGSYTDSENPLGITLGQLDRKTGEIQLKESFDGGINPSFLIEDDQRGLLYAINECSPGGITTLHIGSHGSLEKTHEITIPGRGPCQALLLRSGARLVTADYDSSSLTMVELDEKGIPMKGRIWRDYQGNGPNEERQEAPHPHWLALKDQTMVMTDLGCDLIHSYPLDSNFNPLEEVQAVKALPGSGPRMIIPRANGLWYVVEELSSNVSVWAEEGNRRMRIQSISTVPKDWQGTNWPSQICFGLEGRRLYAANRGHESLAVFDVDPEMGLLSQMTHVPLKARFPRALCISPCGNFLLAAGQEGNSLESFHLDEQGIPSSTGHSVEVFSPSSIAFLRV